MADTPTNGSLRLTSDRLLTHKAAWKPSAIASDIATLGSGTVLAGLFNIALVFLVPKLISVEEYGYWRVFGLYAGYVGFLHFGFVDGALLRWAGRPIEEFHHEIGAAVKYLFWQHLILLGPACLIGWFVLPKPAQFVVFAVAIYAPLYNITAALQFGLQGARIFWPVAISTLVAPGLFLAFVLLWTNRWAANSREVIVLFLLVWCVPLAFLIAWTKPWHSPHREVVARNLVRECVQVGWPMVMTNTGVILVVYADRLAVSWAATIQNFAQYSLAASAMAVPAMAIQASGRVFLSHLAGVTAEARKRIYGISSRTLLITWAFLLPYYFGLGVFVRHVLPKYISSLEYARVMLLGIPFLAAIQILQISYAYLDGLQKHFLIWTAAVLAVSIGATSYVAFHGGSLQAVAGVEVAILGIWWIFNERMLRNVTGHSKEARAKFVTVYAVAGTAYWLATGPWLKVGPAIGLYYLMLALIVRLCCRDDLEIFANQVADWAGTASATRG